MATNLNPYPISETPGKEIGRGYVYIVRELGPDWVVKEFNPLKPDGTPKEAGSYEKSQTQQYIEELQETQRILSQDSIYGDKLIPTYWDLKIDENGRGKYVTFQRRFNGETLAAILQKSEQSFATFFSEHRELRIQMLELVWGAKRALIETGVYEDLHIRNIAVVKDADGTPKLKVFDIPNLIGARKIIYGELPTAPATKSYVLKNVVEKRATRLGEYELLMGVTENERTLLDQKFGIDNIRYSDMVTNFLRMREQLSNR